MQNVFFTSDSHFNHDKIIDFQPRPFANVEEMNEAIISNWNEIVRPSDIVYHLGDFAWKRPLDFLDRLNGQKHLVEGNHDSNMNLEARAKFVTVSQIKECKIFNPMIVLCHYCLRTWNKSRHGSWHLYGHSHGMLPEQPNLSFDIGMDVWGYKPVPYEEVFVTMDKKRNKLLEEQKQ